MASLRQDVSRRHKKRFFEVNYLSSSVLLGISSSGGNCCLHLFDMPAAAPSSSHKVSM